MKPSELQWLAPTRAAHPARDAAFRSYEAVLAKDKAAWLANFAPDGVIEDPFGPSMFDPEGKGHRTAEERAHFWDITIATMERFVFEIRDSFACAEKIRTSARAPWMASTIALLQSCPTRMSRGAIQQRIPCRSSTAQVASAVVLSPPE